MFLQRLPHQIPCLRREEMFQFRVGGVAGIDWVRRLIDQGVEHRGDAANIAGRSPSRSPSLRNSQVTGHLSVPPEELGVGRRPDQPRRQSEHLNAIVTAEGSPDAASFFTWSSGSLSRRSAPTRTAL